MISNDFKGKALEYKKIIVIGCPGSGKSVFSGELHKITGLPLYHMDMLYWNEDKTPVPKDVFHQRLRHAMASEKWIIAGNYGSTMQLRLEKCDTVFFLDYPLDICLAGVRERAGKPRSDMPWTEDPEHEDEEFISFIKSYNSKSRPVITELLGKYPNKNIVIFKQRSDADEFLSALKKRKENINDREVRL